jgi:heme oxygenase
VLPVHFLTGPNENEWKSFAVGIEAKLPDADSRTRAARSAMAMFTAYEDWMAGHE